jgi:hypothetical protein
VKLARSRPFANTVVSYLPIFLFLAYPSFSVLFFDPLKCRTIDGSPYVIADLSIRCNVAEYEPLRIFAIVCVVGWAFGLPMGAVYLLSRVRSQLKKGCTPEGGIQKHLSDLFLPYKRSLWYFELVDYAKKLFIVGIIPVLRNDVLGAVVAMLVVNVYLTLLIKIEPFTAKVDNILAICLHGVLSIVMLVSVLLKLDVAYLSGQAAAGFDQESATGLLVACNVAVMVVSVVAYVFSVRHAEHSDELGNDAFLSNVASGNVNGEDSVEAYQLMHEEEPLDSAS